MFFVSRSPGEGRAPPCGPSGCGAVWCQGCENFKGVKALWEGVEASRKGMKVSRKGVKASWAGMEASRKGMEASRKGMEVFVTWAGGPCYAGSVR